MTTPQTPFQNPQELFQAFNKQSEEWMRSFSANQMQEAMREFNKAWAALTEQSIQNPQEWMVKMAEYQKQQMQLWMNMFGMTMPQQKEGSDDEPVGMLPAWVKPAPHDRRFQAPEWTENPIYDYIKQSYLLASNWLLEAADQAHLDPENQRKLKFYTKYFIDAISPTNFALTNPEVMKHAVETKGQSLIDGLKNMLLDMEKGRISMTDEGAFELGTNLATTPGAVIYETELFQLIQYKPTTDNVCDMPMVIIPPCINKFYILDLQEKNSFVKYCVDQGNTVFLVSWLNPEDEHSSVSWEHYVDGVIQVFDITRKITNAPKVNSVAWCVGGTILASTLAVMEAKGMADSVNSATYFTTLLDFSDAGELSVFIDEVQVAQREAQLKHTGVLSGKDLALAFSMIRANDLIWSYVVNNYLKGQNPTPFDILYWNSDPTNLPSSMYTYYLRNMYLENNLRKPNTLNLCNVDVDLGTIKTPSYFLSTIDDHIAPWKTTYINTELMNCPMEFVLGASGHIAGVINPPAKQKRNYWYNGELGKDADHWLSTASAEKGSWWPHWDNWLKQQGGAQINAPANLGSDQYQEVEPAPGRYVMKRIG